MELSVRVDKNKAHFAITGDIDEKGAAHLNDQFRDVISGSQIMDVEFDFKGVGYIGSSGIGAIILFYKSLAPKGGKISIKNVSRDIGELFEDLDLHNIIKIS